MWASWCLTSYEVSKVTFSVSLKANSKNVKLRLRYMRYKFMLQIGKD
jgi:hypothetical protein